MKRHLTDSNLLILYIIYEGIYMNYMASLLLYINLLLRRAIHS